MPVTRARADVCPGAASLYEAADGALARIRVPGGVMLGDQLKSLIQAAVDLGDGSLELTSRGNLQLRGLRSGAGIELARRLAQAGLAPSETHERVRNIVASPMAGIDATLAAGDTDICDLVADLDRELCARPQLADLPGRFLFAIDDGRGDVAVLDADVTLLVHADGASVAGFDVAVADAVAVMLACAEAFLDVRAESDSQAWRIAEVPGGLQAVAGRARARLPHAVIRPATPRPRARAIAEPVGILTQPDGLHALTVLAPFGHLDRNQGELLLANAGVRGLRFTPWRSIVIPDIGDLNAARTLALACERVGLGVADGSPWYRMSACIGRPGCAKALADVRADARAKAGDVPPAWLGQRVRFSGCERRCGRPHNTDVDIVATIDGYRIAHRADPSHDE